LFGTTGKCITLGDATMEKRPIFQKTPGASGARPNGQPDRVRLNRDEAETIAIRALGFMAEDEDRIGAFMADTGISPDDLRDQAASSPILAAVLDYLTRDESSLLMFAANADIPPEHITPALMLLNGDADAASAEWGGADVARGPDRPSKIMKRR
jgi:hypothetical protein